MNKASEAVSGFPVPLPNAKSQSEIVGFRKKYLSPPLLSSPKNGHRTPIPFSAAVLQQMIPGGQLPMAMRF